MSADLLNVINMSLQKGHLSVILPFLLALWMAWSDVKTKRIPNYLSFGGALAGLGFQLGAHGWAGLAEGFLGMLLGFALLIFFYVKGGMGAGDVKALAALGAWLGPLPTLFLFCYMAFCGVLLMVIFLWWKGQLLDKTRQLRDFLLNWVLLRSHRQIPKTERPAPALLQDGLPYAVAMAMGMAITCYRDFIH